MCILYAEIEDAKPISGTGFSPVLEINPLVPGKCTGAHFLLSF